MRVLHVADLHYALPQLDFVVGAAADFDLVVLAGDALNIASPVPLEAQAVVILEYLARLHDRTTVAVSSGNHDLTGPDERGEQAALWLAEARAAGIPTDGDTIEVGATLVTICPWWDGPAGRAELDERLAVDAARRDEAAHERWLWVYHWPPMGSPTTWTGQRHYGDEDLVGWIERHRPDLVLAGHVHQPPFKPDGAWADRIDGTWVFNPGQQRGPLPTWIELDLDAATATWTSLMGREELRLDEDPPPRSLGG